MFFLVLKASDAENAKRHVVCVCARLLWYCLVVGATLGAAAWCGGLAMRIWLRFLDLVFPRTAVTSCICAALLPGGHAPRLVLLGELAWCTHRARRWCKQRDAVEVQVPCKPSSWYVLSACHVHGLCFSPWQARPGGGCLLRVSDRESCRIPAGR